MPSLINNFSQRSSSQAEQKKPLGRQSIEDKLMASFDENIKYCKSQILSLPKTLMPTGDGSNFGDIEDKMQNAMRNLMTTSLEKSKLEAKIAKKGGGLFDNVELLGKEVAYNDIGRKGGKVENSLTFSYNIDKNRFSNAKHLKASLRVINSAGRELEKIEQKNVALGQNKFKWTPKTLPSDDDKCKLEVDLTYEDEDVEGQSRTITSVADFSGRVTSEIFNETKRKRELMINGLLIDRDRVMEVFADTEKQSKTEDNNKSQMKDNNRQQYLSWIDKKVITKTDQGIVVGGIDWSDPNMIKVIDKNDPKIAYDVNDIVGLYSGDSPAPAPLPDLTGEEKLQKLLERGQIYVGKTVHKELLRGVYDIKINTQAEGSLKLGKDKSFGKYQTLVADINYKDSKGALASFQVDNDSNQDMHLSKAGDEISLKWDNGAVGQYEVSIKVTAPCVVSGCYVMQGKLMLKTDQGDIDADDITKVVS